MKGRPDRLVLVGQLCFVGFLLVCLALHPGLVLKRNQSGVSNYGIHLKTAGPFTLAFGLESAFSALAARATVVRDAATRRLRVVLWGLAVVAMVGLISTYPYSLNNVLKLVHLWVGAATIAFETIASIWLFLQVRDRATDRWLIATELAGFVFALLAFYNVVHALFVAQVLIGVGFGSLLVRVTRRCTRRDPEPRSADR
jgi:hypothetical protein